jgi:hypothetical protein
MKNSGSPEFFWWMILEKAGIPAAYDNIKAAKLHVKV